MKILRFLVSSSQLALVAAGLTVVPLVHADLPEPPPELECQAECWEVDLDHNLARFQSTARDSGVKCAQDLLWLLKEEQCPPPGQLVHSHLVSGESGISGPSVRMRFDAATPENSCHPARVEAPVEQPGGSPVGG